MKAKAALIFLLASWPLAAQEFDEPLPIDPNSPDAGSDRIRDARPDGRPPVPFGGMARRETKLLEKFDKDGDHVLNATERKLAREFLRKERERRAGPRAPRGRPPNAYEPGQPGPNISPAEVKSFAKDSLYEPTIVRTLFLEFEDADWEKELSEFKNTDVDVPAKLMVDGKNYSDVGVHFRGMSSFMMVGENHKRSLNLSLDMVHKDQRLGGYRTLNLLNSHEDPTFLRSVLYYQIAREYIAAPKANFVRLVINGESWGLYVNAQQFNKDFVKEWFGTTEGARWKVPGSPGGRGSLAYLGDDEEAYKRNYQIKSKDEPKAWAELIRLCKVLNQTPSNKLEKALAPLLDIEGALKFLALENVLINNDGYWIRTSDYAIYQEPNGRFHLVPQDVNETFSTPESGGFGGGRARFVPGPMVAFHIMAQGDANRDNKLTRAELADLADAWFEKLDPRKTDKLTEREFTERVGEIIPPPEGSGPPEPIAPGRPDGERRIAGPAKTVGDRLFGIFDLNKDGVLRRSELGQTFERWFTASEKRTEFLTEDQVRERLALPEPGLPGPAGPGPRASGRPRINVKGVEIEPLVAANDPDKPLLSKLLAVPSLRERYLTYVRDIAEKWLDWKKLGPLAEQYHSLIAEHVAADTRKLDSTDHFEKGLAGKLEPKQGPGAKLSLKDFAGQRRAFLLRDSAGVPTK